MVDVSARNTRLPQSDTSARGNPLPQTRARGPFDVQAIAEASDANI